MELRMWWKWGPSGSHAMFRRVIRTAPAYINRLDHAHNSMLPCLDPTITNHQEDDPMPLIFKSGDLELKQNRSPIPHFSWKASSPLEEISKSKYLHFDMKSLHPGKFSYPYHFHRNAEELFVILEGEATLRSQEGFQKVSKGDVIFFEEGPAGTHQFYNHGDMPLVYLDIRTRANVDVCEYPDSGKINILPALDIFKESSKVAYYTGEEDVRSKWPKEILTNE
ncbi:MAG TPA: hypothetical protein DCS07_17620 [Bdellovibrionales bacterium]|nr:hypothetical protein [Bdellovibrionales bacterium]HAS53654.1 hypothetical protein [Nitrospiraceae bacterium]